MYSILPLYIKEREWVCVNLQGKAQGAQCITHEELGQDAGFIMTFLH